MTLVEQLDMLLNNAAISKLVINEITLVPSVYDALLAHLRSMQRMPTRGWLCDLYYRDIKIKRGEDGE